MSCVKTFVELLVKGRTEGGGVRDWISCLVSSQDLQPWTYTYCVADLQEGDIFAIVDDDFYNSRLASPKSFRNVVAKTCAQIRVLTIYYSPFHTTDETTS